MKKTLLLISTLIISLSVDAQVQHNVFNIRNYNRSLALELKQHQAAAIVSDEYGKLISYSNPANTAAKYLHHGQEYDKDLDLYFYPSRIYSILSARFFQTDPKSQYASPYSFLGGDPVNRIDETGNAGKPLVLHHSEHKLPDGKDFGFVDIQSQVGDAYYVPLADFLNGEVPDLPEFNGTVFIDAHMGTSNGGIVEVERDDLRARFKTPREYKVARKLPGTEEYAVTIKAEDLGRELRDFADIRKLEIKNILAGGCEGSAAAESIGNGFVERSSNISTKRFLKTSGLKRDRIALPVGEKFLADEGVQGLKNETRFYVHKKGNIPDYDVTNYKGELKFNALLNTSKADGQFEEVPYADGDELKDMVVNGRIPESVDGHFSQFKFEY